MRLRRILLIVFLAIPMALLTLLVGAFVWIRSDQPAYDTQHPDYAHYDAVFSRVAEELAQSGVSTTPIDFAPLNGGAWKTACLFGGYGKSITEMRDRNAIVSDADLARLDDKQQPGFRLFALEEAEAMIAYVDDGNRAHFIHFRHGLGQFSEAYRGCVSKPETVLTLGTP